MIVTNGSGTVTSNTVTLDVAEVTTASFAAAADAHVRDGTYATQNFGGADRADREAEPHNRQHAQSFLPFNLTGLNTVADATLRLFGRASVATESVSVSVFGVPNNGWTEAGSIGTTSRAWAARPCRRRSSRAPRAGGTTST